MGEQPDATGSSVVRSPQRRSHLEPTEGEERQYTAQQIARSPFGVFDLNGNCRCPNSLEYL
jgi:hypothetical protein